MCAAVRWRVRGFLVQISGAMVRAEAGRPLELGCTASSSYEFCTISGPGGDQCQFEWKRTEWNITTTRCPPRYQFKGNYTRNECGVALEIARLEDTGIWNCRLESYVFGGARGTVRIGEIRVEVSVPTTTSTTTTTTTPPSSEGTGRARSGRGLQLEAATVEERRAALPVSLLLYTALALLVLTIILVTAHKVRHSRQATSNASLNPGNSNASFDSIIADRNSMEILTDDESFVRKVFPHIINFPSNKDPDEAFPRIVEIRNLDDSVGIRI